MVCTLRILHIPIHNISKYWSACKERTRALLLRVKHEEYNTADTSIIHMIVVRVSGIIKYVLQNGARIARRCKTLQQAVIDDNWLNHCVGRICSQLRFCGVHRWWCCCHHRRGWRRTGHLRLLGGQKLCDWRSWCGWWCYCSCCRCRQCWRCGRIRDDVQ